MAAILDGSQDAILALDLDYRVTEWNRGATILYGYSAEEIIGKNIELILPEGRLEEEREILARIHRGERVESYETERRHRDGRLIPISLTVSPIYDAQGRLVGASKIGRDITAQREAERMQRVLVQEMKHRVKNILTIVMAIARQTLDPSRDPAVAQFHERIFALARAQDLVTQGVEDGLSFTDLLGEIFAPYDRERIEWQGEPLLLRSAPVLSLTLALHELATNAAKYGALGLGEGRLRLEWHIEQRAEGPYLDLLWRESGGPPVQVPERSGFGSKLLTMILANDISAEVELNYPPSGFECRIRAPLSVIALS